MQMLQVKEKEGQKILSKISDGDYVYALAIQGKEIHQKDLQNN